MSAVRKLIIIFFLSVFTMSLRAQGVKAGPWVSDTGENAFTLVWTSEVPGMAWAREAVREPLFRKAPVKVCLIHIPMIDHPDKTDYLLQRWLNEHIVPLLNKAGLDLMIGADLHEFMLCEPGTMGNRFPILVNDNERRLQFEYTRGGRIHVSTFNASGEKEFEREF